jgi:hypothetical protein
MSRIKRIGSVLMMIMILGFNFLQNIAAPHASELKESFMTIEQRATPSAPATPPIDAAVPARFETASFGLG